MSPPAIDVESLERATLAAVPPQRLLELPGWLIGFDDGTVGRCRSAVPLAHEARGDHPLGDIEALYRQEGRRPVFRLPRIDAFAACREPLAARGYRRGKPTLVQVSTCESVRALASPAGVVLDSAPGETWTRLFLGDGFDPVDAASRLAILRRSQESVFAHVEIQGHVVAVGSACYRHGWCGIHGMRTAPGTARARARERDSCRTGHRGRAARQSPARFCRWKRAMRPRSPSIDARASPLPGRTNTGPRAEPQT